MEHAPKINKVEVLSLIHILKLVATSIEVAQSYVADVQAVQFVEVKPKVEGFVEDVLVDEGEHVKKGQVLDVYKRQADI